MTLTTTKSAAAARSSTRRFQFSLAQLLACAFVVCVVCGAVATVFNQSVDGSSKCGLVMFGFVAVLVALTSVRLIHIGEFAALLTTGVLLGIFLFPVIASFPQRRARHPCTNNLKNISIALHTYHGAYGSFPPACVGDEEGRPMHSWRVLILPQLGEQALYDQYCFDEPWDGPNNRKLHDRIAAFYRCPDDRFSRRSAAARETSYVVITGPGTVFPGGRRKTSVADVAGASSTILVAEVHSSGIHWMEPRDLDFATMDFQINGKRGASISSKHLGGAMVVMVDGSVQYLDNTMPPKVVQGQILFRDGQ